MPIADFVFMRQTLVQFAPAVDGEHLFHLLPGFAAIATCVHGQRAAQRAGDAGKEFRACQIMAGGKTGYLGAADTCLGINQALCRELDMIQRAMQQDDRAAQAAITYQQIAAQPDEVDRRPDCLRRKRARSVKSAGI